MRAVRAIHERSYENSSLERRALPHKAAEFYRKSASQPSGRNNGPAAPTRRSRKLTQPGSAEVTLNRKEPSKKVGRPARLPSPGVANQGAGNAFRLGTSISEIPPPQDRYERRRVSGVGASRKRVEAERRLQERAASRVPGSIYGSPGTRAPSPQSSAHDDDEAAAPRSQPRILERGSHRNVGNQEESQYDEFREGETHEQNQRLSWRETSTAGASPAASARSSKGDVAISNEATVESKPSSESTLPSARGLCGLANMGNTCFMNSCLQCLSNCPPLAEYFVSGRFSEDLDESKERGNIAMAFGRLVEMLWSPKTPAFSSVRPTEVKRLIGQRASRFVGYEQHDSQEFLRFFLDALHEDLNRIREKLPYEEIKDVEGETEEEAAQRWWRYYELRNDSHIKDIFCGLLRSRVVCKCGHVSTAFDPFWDLSVPLWKGADDDRSTLQDCLKAFTTTETLVGDECYTCSKCKTRQECTKQIVIQRCPRILVVHVKRFSNSGMRRAKLTTSITFPIEHLDIEPYCSENAASRGSTSYSLIGVVNHMGGLGSGHYTAAARNSSDGAWYLFNDANVAAFSLNKLNGSNAYVLFYQQNPAVLVREE